MSSDTIVVLRDEGRMQTLPVCGNDVCNRNPPTVNEEISVTQNPVRRNSMYRVTSIPLDKYTASAQRRIEMQDASTGSEKVSFWRGFCFSRYAAGLMRPRLCCND